MNYEQIINDRLQPFLARYPRIGVMVSGGIDSGTVLFLVLKYIHENNLTNTVTAFTVERTYDSFKNAARVVQYCESMFDGVMVTHKSLSPWFDSSNHNYQTMSGVYEARNNDLVDGVIIADTKMPEVQLVDNMPNPPRFTNYAPDIMQLVIDFTKNVTVGLAIKNNLIPLLEHSHSCIKLTDSRCGSCYWCREREWAFQQNNFADPGTR
jgi:7-cyano-7-deazaguanine synthase in queuosine biosynthesis